MPEFRSLAPLTGGKRLRQLLKETDDLIVCPGVYDGFTARLAIAAGFDALYMTGAGTSMSRLGWADLGLATFNDMSSNAEMIASLDPSIPLIADADTGYGGPVMVSRTVTRYARAGVAALHIEDQVAEKRCGHLLGKVIVERDVYYSRLRAAVKARDDTGSDMLIIARTDARQSYGFEEALLRLRAAVEIGVDVVFPEALMSKDECRLMCEEMRKTNTPVLLNMVPGGTTPDISPAEAKELGFQIMIYPGLAMGPVIQSVGKAFKDLKENGVVSAEQQGGIKDAFNVCGLQECIDIDRRAGGKAFDTVGK